MYPLLHMFFLFKYYNNLTEPYFKKRFGTAFIGIEIEYKQALLYGAIFLVRRFWIVIINIVLNPDCPWTNYEENRYLYKILLFLMV